jgi:hypothetical protein
MEISGSGMLLSKMQLVGLKLITNHLPISAVSYRVLAFDRGSREIYGTMHFYFLTKNQWQNRIKMKRSILPMLPPPQPGLSLILIVS